MTRVKHGSTSHRAPNRRLKHQLEAASEPAKVERNRAYAVLNHGGREVAVVVAPNLADALWQARQLDVVKVNVIKDGGLWLLPTDRL